MANVTSPIEERALSLLGQGMSTSVVASALGVTDGRISQLLADDTFRDKVAELKYQSLKKHNEIDATYDELEMELLEKFRGVAKNLLTTKDILSAIKVINGATRRGTSTPDTGSLQTKVVSLTLPVSVQQNFISNGNSQITEIRDGEGKSQTLVTAQASSLEGLAKRVLPGKEVSAPEALPEPTNTEVADSRERESEKDKRQITAADL